MRDPTIEFFAVFVASRFESSVRTFFFLFLVTSRGLFRSARRSAELRERVGGGGDEAAEGMVRTDVSGNTADGVVPDKHT